MRNFVLCLHYKEKGILLIKETFLFFFFSQSAALLQSSVKSWEMWKVKMGTLTAT